MQKIKRNSKIIFSSILLMGAWFFLCPNIDAQEPDSSNTVVDELIVIDENIEIDTAKRERKHYPQVATISSAIVPGLGQVYNRKYYKVPIIWGGGLALYAYYDWNNTYYHRFKLAGEQLSNGAPVTDPELSELETETITSYKNYYRRHRDRAVIFMGLLYVANIVDALVDAHMLDYDISKDLSLHWEPALLPTAPSYYSPTDNYALGAKIQLKF